MIFTLTSDQFMMLEDFKKAHLDKCVVYNKAKSTTISGGLTYKFEPNGLSNGASVVCCCGKECSLDDINLW